MSAPKEDEFFEAWIQQRRKAPEASVADSVMSRIESGDATQDSGDEVMTEVLPKKTTRWLTPTTSGGWLLLAAKYSAIAAAMLVGVIRLSLFLMPFSELQ